MRPVVLLFLLLLGVDPGTPADPPPTADPPPPPAGSTLVPEGATGEQVLQIAIDELTAGRYENALAVAIPAIAKHPDLEPSFRAVADVAADQLERQRQAAATVAVNPSYAVPSYSPITSRRPAPGRETHRLLWGFDLGLPTGLRVEWKLGGHVVDSIGMRIGGNLLFYDGVHEIADATVFSDFRVSEQWQIEAVAGLLTYYGWAYPQVGAALQYDPKGPMHVNLGARFGPEASVMPDAGVGFIW